MDQNLLLSGVPCEPGTTGATGFARMPTADSAFRSYLCVELRKAESAVGILAKPVAPVVPGSQGTPDSNKF